MSVGPDQLGTIRFRRVVDRICTHLDIPFSRICEIAEVDPSILRNALDSRQGPKFDILVKLADGLDITVDSLITGAVDWDWLNMRHQGIMTLPERYQRHAGSKIRTTIPVLSYIRDQWGEPLYKAIFRELRIHPTVFNQPDTPVSLQMLTDVTRVLKRRGFSDREFWAMGLHATRIPENHRVASAFGGARSTTELYQWLCEDVIALYEKNFEYDIVASTPQSFEVRVTARLEMQEAFGRPRIDTRDVCLYRQGAIAAQPEFIGLRRASVQEKSCVHHGDDHCHYVLSW